MEKELIRKKKHISEFGIKAAKNSNKAKVVSSSSKSSIDIQIRNSLLFKNASKMMYAGARLRIICKGGINFNLKRLVEMEEEEIADRKEALKKFAELEEGEISDTGDDASLSLEWFLGFGDIDVVGPVFVLVVRFDWCLLVFRSVFFGFMPKSRRQARHPVLESTTAAFVESCDNGVAIDIGKAAFCTTLNLLSNAIFSVDLIDPSSGSAKEFKEFVWNMMEEMGKPNLADYFPALKTIDPQGRQRRLTGYFGKIIGVFDELIKTRLLARKTLDHSDETEDMLHTLLGIEESSHEIDRGISSICFWLDLFVAGTDTTSNTLEWALAELLHNPTILSKAQEEMDQIIDKDCPVEEEDLARLPYLHAIIKETFRLHPPTPLLLPRKVEEDVDLCGFRVLKGAKVLGQDFELIPFGAGKRICPTVGFANWMLQLMLASRVHSFAWKLEDGIGAEDMDMDMEDEFGINLRKAQCLIQEHY
ncbi:geraniol 8-hydroxylase-like [Rhododendron vialii]|uniref:geraniol 8-hydroxylase-like n=1 Tax=Rhododendron vialii TaxID=182163 RepID=UPI00265F072E|nr:geraniol 8-hydroxylase-like [Rhododendron vialii]